ncbi:MAG: multidrug ABC transporter ATP-binding protein, partial [Pirellulales bacterium]|nr:multidrug ABC transporter ATP-binding protein [Pirellulales bacterium]
VNEKVSEVMQRIRQKSVLKIGLVGDLGAAVKLLASHPLVQQVEERNGLLAVSLVGDVADYTELPRVLIEAGFGLTLFQEEEMNLETAFMLLTEGISA